MYDDIMIRQDNDGKQAAFIAPDLNQWRIYWMSLFPADFSSGDGWDSQAPRKPKPKPKPKPSGY